MRRIKGVLFWLITALVIPALFFVFLESGLRLAGYGKSYDYFTKIQIDGAPYFQDNPDFGLQFFPVSLNRTPIEHTFAADRPENLVRIFVLGGSAARGFPDPDFGFGRLLEVMLKQALPGKRIEVINTAMTAINSHVVYEIAKAVPHGAADFAIILLGNNEVVGPFGPGTVFQGFSSSLDLIRFIQAARRLRIGQGLRSLAERLVTDEGNEGKSQVWRGMEMFSRNHVQFGDPRLEGVYAHFQQNLQDIIAVLQRGGAHVLLSTVPVNLQDSAPFGSHHNEALSNQQLQTWRSIVSQADGDFDRADWSEAISQYLRAEAIDADYADLQYRLGVAYSRIGAADKAADHLKRARDLDTLRFRADTPINERIRTVAKIAAGNKFTFVDNESAFAAASSPELPGKNLFLEHVHFNFSGNYRLASEFFTAIMQSIKTTNSITPPSEREMARRVVFPNSNTVLVMKKLVKMVGSPPFSNQSNRIEEENRLRNEHLKIEKEVGTTADQIGRYRETLAKYGGDWRLRSELVSLLVQTGGDAEELTGQLKLMLDANPHHYVGHLLMAAILQQRGRFSEEIEHLQSALHYTRGDARKIADVNLKLGNAYYSAGSPENASRFLRDVAHNNPKLAGITLAAYEKLIQIAKQSGRNEELRAYAAEVRNYGRTLVDLHKDEPWVHDKLTNILHLAGFDADAKAWADNAQQHKNRFPENTTQ